MTVQREAQLDDGFRAEGKVHIRRAQFGAGLSFDGAFLAAVGGSNSLTLRGSSIKGRLNLVTREKPPGAMDLRRVVVTELYDDKAVWPDRIKLHGLVYETLREDGPKIKDRLEWLKSNGKYEPQIYRQLAKVYQVTGDEDLARKVLIAEQDERRKSRPGFHGVLAWWGGWFLKATVGYGYNPFRVFLMELAVLEVIGGIVFSILRNDIHPVSPHVVGDYQPWLYSLDLLLPVVNFSMVFVVLSDGCGSVVGGCLYGNWLGFGDGTCCWSWRSLQAEVGHTKSGLQARFRPESPKVSHDGGYAERIPVTCASSNPVPASVTLYRFTSRAVPPPAWALLGEVMLLPGPAVRLGGVAR